jgi:hypothetical protein
MKLLSQKTKLLLLFEGFEAYHNIFAPISKGILPSLSQGIAPNLCFGLPLELKNGVVIMKIHVIKD